MSKIDYSKLGQGEEQTVREEMAALAQKLTANGLVPKVIKTGLLLNKSIVFTGGKRKDLETKIVAQGGFIKSSVTGNTDILVVKDFNEVKGKFEKAEEINSKTPGKIEIIGVEDFESKYF